MHTLVCRDIFPSIWNDCLFCFIQCKHKSWLIKEVKMHQQSSPFSPSLAVLYLNVCCFLPNVSSCARVWHVCICFSKKLWLKFMRDEVGRVEAQHTAGSALAERQIFGAEQDCWPCQGLKSWVESFAGQQLRHCRCFRRRGWMYGCLSALVLCMATVIQWCPLCPLHTSLSSACSYLRILPAFWHQGRTTRRNLTHLTGGAPLWWQGRSLPPWWLSFMSELKCCETSQHYYIKGKLVPSCCLLLGK